MTSKMIVGAVETILQVRADTAETMFLRQNVANFHTNRKNYKGKLGNREANHVFIFYFLFFATLIPNDVLHGSTCTYALSLSLFSFFFNY